MNYNQNINLLKLKNACIITVKGKTTSKKGIFIPIQENDLFVAMDEEFKPKGVHLGLSSWELKQKGQYGDTHLLKQSFSKDFREQMSEEEKKAIELLKEIADVRSCVIGDDLYEEDALILLNLIEKNKKK